MIYYFISNKLIIDKPDLVTGRHYDFFVRAWYSPDVYSDHRSDGIIVDPTPPSISVKRGARVSEITRLLG